MGDTEPGRDSSPGASEDDAFHQSPRPTGHTTLRKHLAQNGDEVGDFDNDDMADSMSVSSEESASTLPSVSDEGWKESPRPRPKVEPLYKRVADDSQMMDSKGSYDLGSEDEDANEEEDEDMGDGEDEMENEEEEEEDIDEGEDEEVEDEEQVSDEEEKFKEGNYNNEDCAVSNTDKSSFGLYSGMSDILSGSSHSVASSSASSRSSTPSHGKAGGLPRTKAGYTSNIVFKSTGGGLLVHHPVTPKKRVVHKTKTDHLSEELNLGYRILMELMSDYQKGSNAPYMDPIELDPDKNKDYLEVVQKPLWLRKIKNDLLDGKYKNITELIGDLRTMLENAYRYYGPINSISKKGLRLEHMMEQKIALLPKEIRERCSLEKTSGQPPEDITQKHRNKTAKISVNGDNFFSYVLYRVRGCRGQREKDLKKRRMEAMRQAKRDRELEVIQWEKDLLHEPLHSQMRAMWELPQIGHFIFLTLKTLNIYEVPQFELERMLLMPRASRSLAMLLTSLLSSPQQRLKISDKPYMPYKVWARKLAHKTLLWYRCFTRENQNVQKVFDQMGIEPMFWDICGRTNPFERQLFHEMTYHQRVWLIKALCDFLLHNHKTVQEVIADHSEADQREYHLGHDRDGNEYLHFPQFCGQDLRIYRRALPPSPEVQTEEEHHEEGSILPIEKVKEFKKMVKKFKTKYEEEAEWEGSRGKKRKRKRGRPSGREVDPEEQASSVSRSRPGNLRQRPRARYKDQYEDLGLSSDDEPPRPRFKSRKSKAPVVNSSSESEDEEVKNGGESTPATTEGGGEETTACNSPAPPKEEPLTRAQQKNPKLTKCGGKKKPTCELCGKSFQNIAALKGHRAVHTKEKQKLAQALEELQKQSKANSEVTSGAPEGTGGDMGNSLVQNGVEESTKENSDIISKDTDIKSKDTDVKSKDTDVKSKDTDVKSGSLLNGEIKTEKNIDAQEVKSEIKVKEEVTSDVEIKDESEHISQEIKKENIDVKLEEEFEEDSNSAPEPPPIYDPTQYLPKLEDFELVVSSVEQLRALIQKFGDLPENAGGKEGAAEDNEKAKEETKPAGKRPSCEVKLHRALCNLLSELSPWESKLLAAQKRMRNKMRHEWNDFQKRGEDYVDPAEEAWASDPEPEPEPPPPPPPESSSSSSSSEESLDEEGNPKRKLRKRRAKQNAACILMDNPAAHEVAPPATQEETQDGYTVSSRGRVRKVKKMINYDGLDFEKLALMASIEAEQEKVRKRRKREDEERERKEQESLVENDNSNNTNTSQQTPAVGVRRYLMSQSGHVMGYIDNEGQVHAGAAVQDTKSEKGVDLSSVRNLASKLVSTSNKDNQSSVQKPASAIPNKAQNPNLKPGVPTVVVAAINNQGSPVYVRVVGEQALQLVKYMRPSNKGPVSQIKLQHHGQTYTVNTNAHMITNNIPGMPDSDANEKPKFGTQPVVKTTANSSTPARPTAGLQGLAQSNSPSVPRVAPISSVVTSNQTPPNTIALAYRGVTKPTRPIAITTQSRTVMTAGSVSLQNPSNQSVAATRLVSASPSVVSSVVPPTTRVAGITQHAAAVTQVTRPSPSTLITSPQRPVGSVVNRVAVSSGVNSNLPQTTTQVIVQQGQQQPTVVQTPAPVTLSSSQILGQAVTATGVAVPGGGGQVQLKLESESLAQLMQRTGSKIVALPNGRGGYTLSLTPGAVAAAQPAQKNQQTQIAVNTTTATKLQVTGAAPMLQDAQQVSQQQAHIISQQGVSRAGTVVHPTIATVSRAGGVMQQQVVRQLVPVSQVAASLSKDVAAGTQVATAVGGQQQTVYQRVGVSQKVFNQLVNSSTATTVLGSGHPLTSTAANQGVAGALQQGVVQKTAMTGTPQTINLQSASTPGQQFVVQQRLLTPSAVSSQATATVIQGNTTGATGALKPVVISQGVGGGQVVRVAHTPVIQQQQQQQQQVVRLQHHGSPSSSPQKLVQIIQPGGGRQVVQMVQQVVATQAQTSTGHQGLIYVQGSTGQVIQQKASQAIVQQQPQQQQQVVVGQIPQQHIVQQVSAQGQPQVVQQQQVRQQPQPSQQQQQMVGQQQTIVQSQGQTVVHQQPAAVHQQQPVVQQTVVHQQPVVQQQIQQTSTQQQTQPQQQTQVQQGRLVMLRTNHGQQVGLQHSDGRVSLLTQEQLESAINNGLIKVHQQT